MQNISTSVTNNFATKTVREIAVENPAATRVFEEYKIDYFCSGGQNFDDACLSAGIEPTIVSYKIAQAVKEQESSTESPEQKGATDLIDYIVEKHHVFTKTEIQRLTALMNKICHKYSKKHPELKALENEFQRLCEDLTLHLSKEEMVLFPFIKHLEMLAKHNLSSPRPPFGTVKNPIMKMMSEHDMAGETLRKMRGITSDFTPPPNACPNFRTLYLGLEELEKDLHRHIHLENNVLFPSAVELEQKVLFGY